MPAVETESTNAVGGAAVIERVIAECVLTPIEGPLPAGQDPRGMKLWVELRTARPKPPEAGSDHTWQRADTVEADWVSYGEKVEKALCGVSKDLELGLFLMEARTRTNGFAGVRDGFWMLRGLIDGFADKGLFPAAVEGDLETQYGPLNWLNEKYSEVLHEIELTRRPDPPNYSLNYRIEAFSPRGGMITPAQWNEAAMAGSAAEYRELLALIKEALSEMVQLKEVVLARYGLGTVSFSETEKTLESCAEVVSGFLRRLAGTDNKGGDDGIHPPRITPPREIPDGNGTDKAGTDAWGDFERLARSGQIDQALAGMAGLAASEPNGRIRFQRKLLLADLCMQTNRKKLAASILQELNEIIDAHKLDTWETSEMVGGVWGRLVRCYRDRAAGTADEALESAFYLKLSRLDPWQALACGEPVRKE